MARKKSEDAVEVSDVESTEETPASGKGKVLTPMRYTPTLNDIFDYVELHIFLLSPMLATNPSVPIHEKHVIEKSKKLMDKAIKLKGKMTKELEMYAGGQDITESKKVEELKGIIRAYMAMTGKVYAIPSSVNEIIALGEKVEEELEDSIERGETAPTVFMRDEAGHIIISSHMILGNIKEVMRNGLSSGDCTITTAKNAVGSICAQDLKWAHDCRFLTAMNSEGGYADIVRGPLMFNGQPKLDENGQVIIRPKHCVRPLRSESMGQVKVCISASEQLPEGTYFKGVFRVRKKGAFGNINQLHYLLRQGVSLGLGQWRGSGGYGSYDYNLKVLEDYQEKLPDWKAGLGLL